MSTEGADLDEPAPSGDEPALPEEAPKKRGKSQAAASEDEPASPSEEAPKRRRKRPAAAVEEPDEAPRAPAREGIPSFARSFPPDAELDALVDAYEAGDYARVRREAPRLAKATQDDDVRRAARELTRRLDPDPLAKHLILVAAALLAFLAAWFWSHPHVP